MEAHGGPVQDGPGAGPWGPMEGLMENPSETSMGAQGWPCGDSYGGPYWRALWKVLMEERPHGRHCEGLFGAL